jgi:hypothetical protein
MEGAPYGRVGQAQFLCIYVYIHVYFCFKLSKNSESFFYSVFLYRQ